jgi:DNA primase
VVNFDPDLAGATAAEKSIALLTEEGFEVKVIALEGGLDPDRFVREQGIEAYMAALRGAKRHSDYLIERARQMFPGRTPDAKTKAMNFLLPHIARMPNRIHRDEFVADAAQKLAIESASMRQELKEAAAHRLSSVRARRTEPASELERVLLRALVLPESDEARMAAANGLAEHPEWYDGMPSATLFDALAHGTTPSNPLDAAPDDASRALLAEVLASQPESDHDEATIRKVARQSAAEQVDNALHTLEMRYLDRRQRELRVAIAEAERRGDSAMVETLTLEKMKVDRKLREM